MWNHGLIERKKNTGLFKNKIGIIGTGDVNNEKSHIYGFQFENATIFQSQTIKFVQISRNQFLLVGALLF